MIDKGKSVKYAPGIKKDKEIILHYQHPYRVFHALCEEHVNILPGVNPDEKGGDS